MKDRTGRFSILAVAVLITLFALFPSGAMAAWKTKIIDGKSFSDFYPRALALERGTNLPHIAYGGSRLFHAFFDGSSWNKEVVDSSPSVGLYASVAIDSNNKIHISYYDATNSSLKYATNKSGAWVKVTVDTGGVGEYSSIAVDSSDKVHISYYDATNWTLKYATNETGPWVKAVVDTSWGTGEYSAIALDSHNKAHISYYDASNEALKYATNKSGLWVISTLETGRVGRNTSIAVDSLNKVHISYASGTGGISGQSCTLRYATNKSGVWKTSVIDTVDFFNAGTSIAMDSNNKVHIGYAVGINSQEGIEDYLKYATIESGAWVKTTIASGTLGFASIAADSNNRIHLSYLDNSTPAKNQIRYVTKSTGAWILSLVDTEARSGLHTSMALDSNNRVHISYSDQADGDLKYATNKSGKWVKATIASDRAFGYTSIAVDAWNKVHISYRDSYGNLKYATNKSGTWVKKVLDTGDVGEYSSIAIDSGNKVHISFYDRANTALKYATNATGQWVTSTIDTGNVGEYCSLAIDSNDKVHISYAYINAVEFPDHITVTGHLKYATNKSGAWTKKIIDNSENAGEFSSIAIDSKYKVHISYYDPANHALKYATNKSGLWLTSAIDTTLYLSPESSGVIGVSYIGGDTSIALDSRDKVRISYFEGLNSGLKYVTNNSGEWLTSMLDNSGTVGEYPSIAIDSNDGVHVSYYDMSSGCLKYATDAN